MNEIPPEMQDWRARLRRDSRHFRRKCYSVCPIAKLLVFEFNGS
jgi:hypothetical protein